MCAVSIPLKPGGCCLQEAWPWRCVWGNITAGLVGLLLSQRHTHTPTQTSALTALSFIHCYTNKQGRLFPVQRFTDVGERRRCSAEKQTNPSWKPTLWYGGSPVPEYSFILFNENIMSSFYIKYWSKMGPLDNSCKGFTLVCIVMFDSLTCVWRGHDESGSPYNFHVSAVVICSAS